MPSLNYMNNGSAPFWDFVASLEQQGPTHPFFSQNSNNQGNSENDERREADLTPHSFDPWGWAGLFGNSGIPHHGPPLGPYTPTKLSQEREERASEKEDKNDSGENRERIENEDDNAEGPFGKSGSGNEERCRNFGEYGQGRHGCHGRHHGLGGHHGPRGFRGPPFGPPHHSTQGRRGPWGRGPPFDASFFGNNLDPAAIMAQFWERFTDEHPLNSSKETEGFVPEADVFDTESAFVVHVALSGAKKENVGVNWDAEKSELSVTGVVYRPGDEALLKTLAINDRKIGSFERKIRLGSRANPAQIDADGISAKLEDGVLAVQVPKMDSSFIEVRKVDIE